MPYDPIVPGPLALRQLTLRRRDEARGRMFPVEIWHPREPGAHPLVGYSHHAGGSRLVASLLCEHVASHGYVVAALDHSEVVAAELAGREGETPERRAARVDAIVASRVPDLRFLIDTVANGVTPAVDPARIALVGHSFGGWAVLAATEADRRVRAVVAMAPGGASDPGPGVLALTLRFAWGRDVPSLYLAAEDDVPVPMRGVRELFTRTPASKRMLVLRRADHQHFVDDVAGAHEAVRTMDVAGEAAWIPAAMRPAAELASAEEAHTFVHGLTLAHLDATLRNDPAAVAFLDDDVESALAARGVDAFEVR